MDCDVNLNVSQKITLASFETKLIEKQDIYVKMISWVPVIVVVNTQLKAKLTANVDAAVDVNTGLTNTYSATLGAIYENGSWTGKYNLTPTLTIKPVVISGMIKARQKLIITPEVSVKLYDVVGPYFTPEMYEQIDAALASPSLDWNASLKVGLDATVGANVTILGKQLANYSKTYSTDKDLWISPNKVEVVAGNNQTGTAGQQLATPVKIKVSDNLNNALSKVPVYFTVTQGGGSVAIASIKTDANGFAQTNWTMGTLAGTQTLEVKVKKADETLVQGTPLVVSALYCKNNNYSGDFICPNCYS